MKKFFKLLVIVLLLSIIVSCGGGNSNISSPVTNDGNISDNVSVNDSNDALLSKTGKIVDISIDGLEYEVDGVYLKTEDSHFFYNEGSKIKFYINDIYIGETDAKDEINLFDIVSLDEKMTTDKEHNIFTLLGTFDNDHNINNGVILNTNNSVKKSNRLLSYRGTNTSDIDIKENSVSFNKKIKDQFDINIVEGKTILTRTDLDNKFFMNRLANHYLTLEQPLRDSNIEIWNDLHNKSQVIVMQLDSLKEIFKGSYNLLSEKELTHFVEAFHAWYNMIELSKNGEKDENIDKIMTSFEELFLAYNTTKKINKDITDPEIIENLISHFEKIGIRVDSDSIENFFKSYGTLYEKSDKLPRHFVKLLFTAVETFSLSQIKKGKFDEATNNLIKNNVEGWFSVGKVYITCKNRPTEIENCLENVYDSFNKLVVGNVGSITASATYYVITKDNVELADSFEARRKALKFFIKHNLDKDEIIENIQYKNFFDIIGEYTFGKLFYNDDMFFTKLEDKLDIDINDDAKNAISNILNHMDRYLAITKGVMFINTIKDKNRIKIQYIDPMAKNNDNKHIICSINNRQILDEHFLNSKDFFIDNKLTEGNNQIKCTVYIQGHKAITGTKSVLVKINDDYKIYSPLCSDYLYLTELVLDNNWKSYLGDKITTTRRRRHKGIDIKSHIGNKVVAVQDGKVEDIGFQAEYIKNGKQYPGAGYMITIKNKNYKFRFFHLNKIFVKKGELVKAGQLIAESGKSGGVSPHLHFEIWDKDNHLIDPLKNKLFKNQSEVKIENYNRGHVSFYTEEAPNCGYLPKKAQISDIPDEPLHVIASDFKYANKIKVYGYGTTGATKYKIYRYKNKYSSQYEKVDETVNSIYFDNGLKAGDRFYYRIQVCNGNRCSDISTEGDYGNTKKKIDEQNIAKPILKSPGSKNKYGNILSGTTQTFSWNSSKNATSYWVAVRDIDTWELIFNHRNIQSTSIEVDGLKKGHRYFWNITACNENECSDWSEPLYFQIKNGDESGSTLVLNPPTVICHNNKPVISLSWNEISGVSNYKIHSNMVFSSGIYWKDIQSRNTQYDLKDNIKSNFSYRLYVRAELDNGNILNSNEINVNTPNCDSSGGNNPPSKPKNLNPGSTNKPYPLLDDTNIELRWSDVNDADSYKLTIFDLNTNSYLLDNYSLNQNFYDTGNMLRKGHKYFWQVKACNDGGCSSNQRVYFIVKGDIPTLSKPTGLTPGNIQGQSPAEVDGTNVTLRWNSVNNATYYKVYVVKGSTGHSGTLVVRNAKTNNTYFYVDNLERGTKYWWYIYACNSDSCSESDFYGFETTINVDTPNTPNVSIDQRKAQVSWNIISGATKYYVKLYDIDGNDDRSEYTAQNSITFTNLIQGHHYKVKVRAYINNKYGNYSNYKNFYINKEQNTNLVIDSISPNPITKSNDKQYINIIGRNFTSDCRVYWKTSNGSSGIVSSSGTNYISNIVINLYIRVNGSSHTWYFKVVNGNGKESEWKSVSVHW